MKWTLTIVVIAVLLASACQRTKTTLDDERIADVAEKGSVVMPFELDATTHVFEKTSTGGLQQVVADTDDPQQIALVRQHLQVLAEQFAAGNFHDPAMIHGEAMPGLHELVMGHDRIKIAYSEIESGGQILYESEDKKLVRAIHSWFDAQLGDHGEHAQDHH